jgi:hypothetical protein
MTDADPDAHRRSTEKTFPKLGETTMTAEILAVLGALTTREEQVEEK